MWRVAIVIAACGGASTAPVPPPRVATPGPIRVNEMLARVSYQNTNTWIDISIHSNGSDARRWCEVLVKRLEHHAAPVTLVVERGCESIELPRVQRRGFTLSLPEPLDALEVGMIGADRAPEPPITTHVSLFDTLASCELARLPIVAERTKAATEAAEAAAVKRRFADGQIAIAEQSAKHTCESGAETKLIAPCRVGENACYRTHRVVDGWCEEAQRKVRLLKGQPVEVVAPPVPVPACVELT